MHRLYVYINADINIPYMHDSINIDKKVVKNVIS